MILLRILAPVCGIWLVIFTLRSAIRNFVLRAAPPGGIYHLSCGAFVLYLRMHWVTT